MQFKGSINRAWFARLGGPVAGTHANRAQFDGFGQPGRATAGPLQNTTQHALTFHMRAGGPITATQPGQGGTLRSVPRTTGRSR